FLLERGRGIGSGRRRVDRHRTQKRTSRLSWRQPPRSTWGMCVRVWHPCHATEQTAGVPEERQLVPVLFADFVGSTASARGRDSEVVRRAYAETYARLRLAL